MADNNIKIESITTQDGRKAEKHTSIDENGNEIVEIFAEEARPLKLEKRIVREKREVISKEVHQTVKDGEITYEEVLSNDVDVPLQVKEKISTLNHSKVVDGDYVRKEELPSMISDGVIAGISALMEKNNKPANTFFKAQSVVEENVEKKKASNITYILGGLVIAQLVISAALYFMS